MTIAEVPSLLLRRPNVFWSEDIRQQSTRKPTLLLYFVAMIGYTVYGAILGIGNGPMQVLASASKLPALYILTIAICFPVLHVLNLLFGGQSKASELMLLLLTGLAATATILVAFAPISVFFWVTGCGYDFYRLLNLVIIGVASFIGFRLFVKGCSSLAGDTPDSSLGTRKQLLRTWVLLVAFVGCQLSWTLRPFFGTPTLEFSVFRKQEGNFVQSVAGGIAKVFQLADD